VAASHEITAGVPDRYSLWPARPNSPICFTRFLDIRSDEE